MVIYRIAERCGWWPQGIKEWVEKTFPGAKILDWEDKTFQCEEYYGHSRSGHREVVFEWDGNIIPGAYKPGWEIHRGTPDGWDFGEILPEYYEYQKSGTDVLFRLAP